MMETNNLKIVLPVVIGAFVAGGLIDHFVTPTKIKTVTEVKTEIKTVKEQVVVDRVITKVVKPDGTITEVTTEKDRSIVDSKDKAADSTKTVEITNPKQLGVAVVYKQDIFNIGLPVQKNFGTQVNYDTGVFSTFVTGSVFMDGTAIIGLGVKL